VRIIAWNTVAATRPALSRFAKALRPTPDRVRETLFNWLGQDLDGLSCLDLFAGSGALGFEAASRGAARVVMVDQSPKVLAALEANAKLLGADERVQIVRADAVRFVASVGSVLTCCFSTRRSPRLDRPPGALAGRRSGRGWRHLRRGRNPTSGGLR
jgi:16S rRNA G966 N2-methylase RsmD